MPLSVYLLKWNEIVIPPVVFCCIVCVCEWLWFFRFSFSSFPLNEFGWMGGILLKKCLFYCCNATHAYMYITLGFYLLCAITFVLMAFLVHWNISSIFMLFPHTNCTKTHTRGKEEREIDSCIYIVKKHTDG